MPPRLSVLMPNYNHEKFIGRAIEAIVSQSRPPDEFIILDDGSTDNSAEAIAAYAARHPVIRFVRNHQNQGFHRAAQAALDLATGDYVYPCAADDFVLPEFFERAMTMANNYPTAGSIAGECVILNAQGAEIARQTVPHWRTDRFVSPESFLHDYLDKMKEATHSFISAVIYKKSEIQRVDGFRKDIGFWCDTFAFRVIGLRSGICFLKHPSAVWTVLPDSLCHSTTADPLKESVILRRLLQLMRSNEFADLFPMDYTERWGSAYRDEIVARAVSTWCAEPAAEYWNTLPDQRPYDLGVKRILWRFHRMYRRFLAFQLKRSLPLPTGDELNVRL
jgi:glycosyltransferase involved in cell wall biosynthesis